MFSLRKRPLVAEKSYFHQEFLRYGRRRRQQALDDELFARASRFRAGAPRC